MKNKVVLFFLLAFFSLSSSLGFAETFTYNPQWKVNDSYDYQTNFSFEFSPKGSDTAEKPVYGELKLQLRYQVVQVTPDYTEFAIKVESVDGLIRKEGVTLTLADSLRILSEKDQKRYQEFLKLITSKNLVHYKMDPKGTILEFTHLPELTDLGIDLAALSDKTFKKSKDFEKNRYLIQVILNIVLNHNLYLDTTFSPDFGPHSSRYLLREYPLNQVTPDSLVYHHKGVGFFMPQPFTVELPGTTSVSQNEQATILSSTHPYTKKELLQIGQTILDHTLLSDKDRMQMDKIIQTILKSPYIQINGAIKHQMTVLNKESLANSSHSQWEYSLKAPKSLIWSSLDQVTDQTPMQDYQIIFKAESTRIK